MEDTDPRALERVAAGIAAEAGARIAAALSEGFAIDYKDAGGDAPDPVTEVDRAVEALVRGRLAERCLGHAVVGEEDAPSGPEDAPVVWAIDPIDGTVNFVAGLPLFACSLGALVGGRPVAGAVWCAATHRLGPGTYHGHAGGGLFLDGEPVATGGRASRCAVAGAPEGRVGPGLAPRVTGSSAVELAWAASGRMAGSLSRATHLWDVAGGLALVAAAGGAALENGPGGWAPFAGFARGGDARPATLALWRGTVAAGVEEAAARRLAAAEDAG